MRSFSAEAFEDAVDPLVAALAAEQRRRGAAPKHPGAVAEAKARDLLVDEGASLLALRLAREARGAERVLNLLAQTTQEPRLAILIGRLAGIPAALQYAAAARELGAVVREILPSLYASASPQLFVCGGASLYRGVLNMVSRLDVATGTWSAIPPMRTARRLCAAAVVGSSLYIAGGEFEDDGMWPRDGASRQFKQVKSVEKFDILAGTWSSAEDMPTARAGCTAAAQSGLLYVFGGRIAETVGAAAERLDTALGRWERLPSLPSARSGCAAATLLGVVYVLGGKGSDGQILASAERFDPCRGRWQVLPPMLTPRSACACGVLGGRLFIVGGFNGMEGLDSVDAFDPLTGCWETQPPMRARRIGAGSVGAGGKLYVLGGKTDGDFSLLCECFDPGVGTWEFLPPMLERHVYCAAAAVIGCS